MTTIASGHRVDVARLKAISPSTRFKAPPGLVADLEEVWKSQFRIPNRPADNDPSNVYATVTVNGRVVATLYNNGAASMSNADGARLGRLPSLGESETRTGPVLAQARAEEIAEMLGGTIETAATAQSQAQWLQRPPMQWTYDYAAIAEAMAARNAQLQSTKAFVQAQIIIAQTGQS